MTSTLDYVVIKETVEQLLTTVVTRKEFWN